VQLLQEWCAVGGSDLDGGSAEPPWRRNHRIAILEGLDLREVPDPDFTKLIALPLEGLDSFACARHTQTL